MTRSESEPAGSVRAVSGWSATAAGASAATTGPTAGADDGAASGADNGFAAALAAALLPGLVLERELVGGAMARVFVAREVALDRRVVAKVLPPTLAAGINRERFRREIQLAAQLQHPHIVPLLSAGEVAPVAAESAAAAAGSLYYTMPFIEGESLRAEMAARAARGVPFTAREVLRILRDVAEALGYAHGRGVVHRDVKPGNVLLQHGHALVTDFGVAKALASSIGGAPAGTMTTLGMAIGTPAYMAPEQLAADPAADQRMDLYATGLVAYELLSGVSPFAAASPQATLAAQLTRVPADIAQLRPDVPPALAAVVMQCLAKDAADRPQTAEVLLAALDAVGETSSASRASGEPARRAARIAAPAATRSARSRSPIVAAAVLAVAAAGAVATRAHPREERPAGSVATTAPPANPARPAPSSAAAGRPTLSSADSAAIAAAVERQFERAALRHAPPPTAAPQRAPWPLAVAPSESAALGRAARAAVVDSLVRAGERWSRFSPDMMRALVGHLNVTAPRVVWREGDGPPDSGRDALPDDPARARDGAAAFGAGRMHRRAGAFAIVAATLPAPTPGTPRIVTVMLHDGTGRRDLHALAPLLDGALRAQLRQLGSYDLTDVGLGVIIRNEHVPDDDAARATGAAALVRGTITAAADHVVADAAVYDARHGAATPVHAEAPTAGAPPLPALAMTLAGPLARAVAAAVEGSASGSSRRP